MCWHQIKSKIFSAQLWFNKSFVSSILAAPLYSPFACRTGSCFFFCTETKIDFIWIGCVHLFQHPFDPEINVSKIGTDSENRNNVAVAKYSKGSFFFLIFARVFFIIAFEWRNYYYKLSKIKRTKHTPGSNKYKLKENSWIHAQFHFGFCYRDDDVNTSKLAECRNLKREFSGKSVQNGNMAGETFWIQQQHFKCK